MLRRSFSIILLCLTAFAFACPAVHGATFTVTTLTDSALATANDGSLRGAILAANADGSAAAIVFNISGGGTITLAKMLPILTNPNGTSIDGANSSQGAIVIDGGSTSTTTGDRIFFAGIAPSTPAAGGGNMTATASAVWTFSNLTLQNGNARGGAGGNGGGGCGGGGAGLGGAIFVNAGNLAIANLTFTGNSAIGGAGATQSVGGIGGGGGGMGGNAGSGVSSPGRGGGGGGFGLGANGSDGGVTPASAGTFTGALKAGNGPGTTGGGAAGGGGSGAVTGNSGGGGGGIGGGNGGTGSTTTAGNGGAGGFGGGGGGGGGLSPSGGNGGYGGGGGGAGFATVGKTTFAGNGGFGGGGGGNNTSGGTPNAGLGGFGAGNGSAGTGFIAGGGGAGLGGAIFVRPGAGLSVGSGVSFSGGTVIGGTGANAGQGLAANLFLDGASAAGFVAMGSGAALDSSSTLAVRINGVGTAGTNYSQLSVTGSVSLGNAQLILTGSYVPLVGNSFTILANDGGDAITGTFNGLAEGATVVVNGANLKISYVGGTGNDVTLFTAPEIAVEQPVSTDLVDGTASIDLGGVIVGSSSAAKTFTIRNTGTADLTLGTITKDGTNPDDFTVNTTGMLTTVTPGNSTTFTVTFTPAATGARSAAIHIASNDSDENPFDIALTGTGLTIYEDWAISNSVSTDPGANAGANLKAFAFGYAPGGGAGTLGYTGTFAGNGTIASTGQPTIMFEPLGNGVDFRALFVRRKDYEAAGLTYTPQFSATMSTWQNSAATPTVLADDGTYQIVSVPYPAFIAGKKARFFQIAVSIP